MPVIVLPIPMAECNQPLPSLELVPLAEPLPPDDSDGQNSIAPAQTDSPIGQPQGNSEGPEIIYLVGPSASRRLAESLVLFVSAILFLRSMAVEPFGVPTGSMAPTLTGNHKVAPCPHCGYLNRVGEPGKQHASYPKATCSNCGKGDIDINDAPGGRRRSVASRQEYLLAAQPETLGTGRFSLPVRHDEALCEACNCAAGRAGPDP